MERSTASPFEGGEGRDIKVALGSNTFLPGFEEQLIGVAAGDKRTVRATFPEAYAVRSLAGPNGRLRRDGEGRRRARRVRHRRRIRQEPRRSKASTSSRR